MVAESVDANWRSTLGTESPRSIFEDVQALFTRSRVRVNHDSATAEKNSFIQEYYQISQIQASIAIQIMLDGRMFGVLSINQCSAPRHWQPAEIELLEKLATQVEIAIQQGILYQQVHTLARNLESQVAEKNPTTATKYGAASDD
ncbi:MAG: GAF domain-containing protein [Leptolyngbyaceae cyanobacterium SU_3_3]|nr:GAF domain-containing protein [Leptolyngbyaceae cyanobacterium SU_3_3]